MDGISHAFHPEFSNGPVFPNDRHPSTTPVQPVPFSLARTSTGLNEGHNQEKLVEIQSSSPAKNSQAAPGVMSTHRNQFDQDMGGYNKLNKGDVGYGGNAFAGSSNNKQVAGEGLLAKKLRDLGVCNQSPPADDHVI